MTLFKKTSFRSFSKSNAFSSPENNYWKNYEFPTTIKEYSYIDHISVCPVEPYYIAVTSGPKIDVYHQQSLQVWRSLTRFQKQAFGGKFRRDGQLILSGSDESHVKLFNVRHKELLRSFKGHKGPVERVDFVTSSPQAVSFSDDKTVAHWDIADEKLIQLFDGHTDFVRAGVCSPVSEHIVYSGSYDHTVKTWDTRTGNCVSSFSHGSPVRDLLCYPTGSVIASAGGNEVKLWDAVAGRLLTVSCAHHKIVTCLCMATRGTRLLSGSLDKHVKVFDVSSHSVVHSFDHPSPVLALNVTQGDSTIALGLLSENTGLIAFHQRTKCSDSSPTSKKQGNRGIFKYLGKTFKPLPGQEVVSHISKEKMSKYDVMLRKFEFSKALDAALQYGTANKTPHITMAVLKELLRRGSMAVALAGRDAKGLNPMFRFLTRNFRNPVFQQILIEVANIILDIYGKILGENPKIVCQLTRLLDEVEKDVIICKNGMHLLGVIEMLFALSNERPLSATSFNIPEKTAVSCVPSKVESTPQVVFDIS